MKQLVFNLAAVAALRFERTHEPERHNLYNDWDKVQAHEREFDRDSGNESFRREWTAEKRKKLSELLKLARTIPERLPSVIGVRSFEIYKNFLVRFPWGVVAVESRRLSLLEPVEYRFPSLPHDFAELEGLHTGLLRFGEDPPGAKRAMLDV